MGKLATEWISAGGPTRGNKQKRRRAKELCTVLLDDPDIADVFFDVAQEKDLLVVSVAEILRAELSSLQEQCVAFGKFSASTSLEDIDYAGLYGSIQRVAPSLDRLLRETARQRRDPRAPQAPVRGDTRAPRATPRRVDAGRITLITSMLSLGMARNTGNCYARLLGHHLHAQGLKRPLLKLFHYLGVVDGYTTLLATRDSVAEQSKLRT